MTRPRVLLVDDHRVVTEGLAKLLSHEVEIVEALNDARLLLDRASRLNPDIIVLDISMPYANGLDLIRQLEARGFTHKIVVLTMHADANLAVETLKAGASAFVLKESSGEELMAAVHAVMAGHTYLASDLTKDIVTLLLGPARPGDVELTTQQREVLRLLVRGHRAKEVAEALGLSTRTVEGIKQRMMQAFNVHSTGQLVRYAVQHRLASF
jgi:DNA-binding NarL/FixJ family response regulator